MGSAFSKVMVNMQLATETGGKKLENFAKVAGMSASDFKKAFKDDAAGAILSFINGLANAESQGKTAIGMLDEMGIKEVRMRDSLLRAAGASDVFSDSLKLGTKAWDENIALTNEAEERYKTTESQLKIMWNRLKDVAITLGDALIPAVMSAIDAAEPLIKQIESGAKAFADMDEEQQRTILKMIAFVAAVGPASIVLGNLTTGIGGVLKVGSSLAGMLGKAGGAGLVGRIGMLGMGGPVGLAVAGVGALALGIYAFNEASQKSRSEILKSIEAREKEIKSTDDLIRSFEELKNKNKLSTDEVLRYMDIMAELKDAKTEEAIKALTDEQAALLEKSGLTNEEMTEFLELNGKIVEKAPEAAKAISEQGTAYAAVLDEVKKLNEAERQRLVDDTWLSLSGEMERQADQLREQERLQKEIAKLEQDRTNTLNTINDTSSKIRDQQEIIRGIEEEIKNASAEELGIKEEALRKANFELLTLIDSRSEHEKTLEKLDGKIGKQEESLKKTEQELKAFDELVAKYEQMVLYEVGITAEKGKGLEAIRKEQEQINTNRKALEEFKKTGQATTSEYEEQNRKLNEQQSKLDKAKKKLEDINKEAGRTVYKDVNMKTNPSVDELNRKVSARVQKWIDLAIGDIRGPRLSAYAEGTSNHKGGAFIAGEEGFELGRSGNRWEMLNLGMYNRPAGYEVFTHDESKKIIQALNRMPAYASGASRSGEANRIVSKLNSQQDQSTQKIVINPAPVYLGGHLIEEIIFNIADSKLANKANLQLFMKGEMG